MDSLPQFFHLEKRDMDPPWGVHEIIPGKGL